MNSTLRTCPVLPLVLFLSAAAARGQAVVDFDTPTLASPPATAFPFYTPGGGSTGQAVRLQCLCPTWFLAAQNLGPSIVTHVGLSLAGQATYSRFELRAGASNVGTLTRTWTTNLPDQRVQVDLANVPIVGGGTVTTPANQWVEFELAHPFVWQPGQDVVVDLTTRIAVPGRYLGTTTSPGIARAYSFDFQGQATASATTAASGFVFRLRFAPLGMLPAGQGCANVGAQPAVLSASGSSTLGSSDLVLAVGGAAPATFGAFVLGLTRQEVGYGGGCTLRAAAESVVATVTDLAGASILPVPVPGWPELAGLALHTQFVHLAPASPATVPAVFSNAGTLVFW